MSGEHYVPRGSHEEGMAVFSFDLSYPAMHWLLLDMAIPPYIIMWMWLSDPPVLEEHSRGLSGIVESIKRMWTAMKSFAFFMLVLQCFGMNFLGILQSPASSNVQAIAAPSTFVSGIGSIIGQAVFTVGIWVFKNYLLKVNWRFTLIWSHVVVAVCGIINLMIIWNTWGFQNGWFYTLQLNVPQLVQGFYFLFTQIATAEISPPGLEATYYEMMTSCANGAQSLGTGIQNQLAIMLLDGVNETNWVNNHCAANNGTWSEHPNTAVCEGYQNSLTTATWITLALNLVGAIGFVWFLPKNGKQCRAWQAKMSWRTSWAAILNFVLYFSMWGYGIYTMMTNTFFGGTFSS